MITIIPCSHYYWVGGPPNLTPKLKLRHWPTFQTQSLLAAAPWGLCLSHNLSSLIGFRVYEVLDRVWGFGFRVQTSYMGKYKGIM